MSGVAAGVIIALLAGFLYLVLTDDQPDGTAVAGSTSDTPSPSATTSEEVSDEPSPSKTPREKPRRPKTAATVGDVRDLPAGVFCRDLNARGYSYVAAVDYWRMHGQPNQMDTDGNGVPCETVYPDSDVAAYWGEPDVPDVPDVPDTSLSAGLFCRDLYAQGLSYADAVAYWSSYGSPDRMDEDLNGIPCETVYPDSDVAAYWGDLDVPDTSLSAGLFCRDLYAQGVSYADAVAYWWSYGSPDRMDEDLNGIPCETVYPSSDVDAFW